MDIRLIFNALSDPTRLAMVQRMVAEGPLTVGVLAEPFDMSVPAISQHLRVLREAGVVDVRREAQRRYYSIKREALQNVADWADSPTAVPKTGGLTSFLQKRAARH